MYFDLCSRSASPWLIGLALLLGTEVVPTVSAADCASTPPGLVGWWPGDGSGRDLVGGNDGSLKGGATASAPGLVGSAFGFDGISGHVQIPDSPALRLPQFTVEAWVRFDSLDSAGSGGSPAGQQYIVLRQNADSYQAFDLEKTNTGNGHVFRFIVATPTGTSVEARSSTLISTGVWYHIAGVRGPDFIQLYVNGDLQGQARVSFAQTYGDYPLLFGTTGHAWWDHRLSGQLDEVALYNRPLRADEIAGLHAAGVAGKCKDVIITAQPSSQAVLPGTDVSFTATATGLVPLSYQWRREGTNLTGATSASLTLPNVQPSASGQYDVVVTNVLGSTNSIPATLTVLVLPYIVSAPRAQTVLRGTNVSFRVVGGGTAPFSYQWRKDGSPLSGRTGTALELFFVTTNAIGSYDVVVSNLAGAVTSTPPALLTVLVPPYVITPPDCQAVLLGGKASLEVLAGGTTPLAYQWRKDGSPMPGRTDAFLQFLSVSTNDLGSYDVVVSNVAGSLTSSPSAILSVLRPPRITVEPTSISRVMGSPGALRVSVEGDPVLTYQWQKNGAAIARATNSFLSLSRIEFADEGGYRAIVTNAAGSATSAAANLTVMCPQLTISPAKLPDAQLGTVYRWLISSSGDEGPHVFSVSGALPPGLNQSTARGVLVISGTPSSVGSASFDVLVADTNNCTGMRNYTLTVARVPDPQFKVALCRAVCGTNCSSTDDLEFYGLTNLWAASYGISNLSGLEMATNLTELHLEGNAIADLRPLKGLYKLTRLNLARNAIANLSPLGGLTNLTWLDLSGNPVLDYSPVSELLRLKSLAINNGWITNLQFVTCLTRLEELQIHDNRLRDISPLRQLPNLNWLDLRWNYITNHAILSGTTNLTRLYLGGTWMTNAQFLAPLSRLTLLNLEQNYIKDIFPLAGLANLSYLVLSGNPIAVYKPLLSLSNLSSLELRGNSISNVAFLANLRQLNYADLAYNAITDLSCLAARSNLSLVLDGNPKVDLSRVTLLTNVTRLWLNGNGISNVSSLSAMPQLRALGLEGNHINNIQPLTALTNLEHLALSANPATNLPLLGAFTSLTGLRLEANSINGGGFLSSLTRLQFLSLSTNHIDLGSIANAKELSSLYCAHNQLTNVAPLGSLPKLAFVDIRQNLLNTEPGSPARDLVNQLRSRAVAIEGASVKFLPQDHLSISLALQTAPSWHIPINRTSHLPFSVWAELVAADELIVSAVSSDPLVLASSDLVLTGTNSDRTLSAAATVAGKTTITLTLQDAPGGLSLSTNILTEVSVPDPNFSIPDLNLSNLLCSVLQKPAGITSVDLLNLTQLSAVDARITNLYGLQWAENLTTLYLGNNSINDLAPLSNLTHLTSLMLNDNDSINDLEALSALTNLTFLDLSGNVIPELPPLYNLTNLRELLLDQNRIRDISAVLDLPNLAHLDTRLNLLGAEEDAVVEALRDRGVEVVYAPQRGPPTIDVRTNWIVAPGASSSLTFSIYDTGRAHQHFGLRTNFPTPELRVTMIPRDEFNRNWTLGVTPQLANTVGFITLSATNDVGYYSNATIAVMVTPLLALEQVLPPLPLAAWTNDSAKAWFGQNIVTRNGESTAQSGAIDNGEVSQLQTTLEGPGRLTFWWKISSETNCDWLEFTTAEQTNAISGEVDWEQQVTYVPTGSQTITWRYCKNEVFNRGLDAAWLSDVTFEPGTWLEISGAPTNGQCQLILHGIPGAVYGVFVATNLTTGLSPSAWQPLAPLVLATNSSVPFIDTNAAGSQQTRFYRARVMAPLRLLSISIPKPASVKLLVQNGLGQGFKVEASTNLFTWSTVTNYIGSSALVTIRDRVDTNWPNRFYRAVQFP